MSCQNPFKRALIAPMFVEGMNRHGRPIWRRRSLINVETVEKLRLSEVQLGDWDLPSLHQALLRLALPEDELTIVDGSEWFAGIPGGTAGLYRNLFLALTGGVVLFETFLEEPKEAAFVDSAVRPAFESAVETLGDRPAIFPLCGGRHSSSPLWFSYPDAYRAHFTKLGIAI